MKNSSPIIKIIVLVLSSAELPWSRIESEGQRSTFASENTPITSFFWIRGTEGSHYNLKLRMNARLLDWWYAFVLFFNKLGVKGPKSFLFAKQISAYLNSQGKKNLDDLGVTCQNSVLSIPLPEHKSLIGLKTLLALEYVSDNFSFDYVVRTNSSSFLDIPNLEQFLCDEPREHYVAGFQGDFFGESFTSGAGYIMSKDVVAELVSPGFNAWQHDVIDDVAFSRIIQRDLKITPKHIERVTLTDPNDEFFGKPYDQTIFHYRCKTSNPDTSICLMRKINQKIIDSQNETS